jgi:hypothetical protein
MEQGTETGAAVGEIGRLVGLLARRAEQLTKQTVFPAKWPQIEARVEKEIRNREETRGLRRKEAVQGAVPLWMIAAASRANLGLGEEGTKRGAPRRLADHLAIESAFAKLGQGIRGEEIAAASGLDEERVFRALKWAKKQYALFDDGDRGWFFYEQRHAEEALRANGGW